MGQKRQCHILFEWPPNIVVSLQELSLVSGTFFHFILNLQSFENDFTKLLKVPRILTCNKNRRIFHLKINSRQRNSWSGFETNQTSDVTKYNDVKNERIFDANAVTIWNFLSFKVDVKLRYNWFLFFCSLSYKTFFLSFSIFALKLQKIK